MPTFAGNDPGFLGQYYSGTSTSSFDSANLLLSRVDSEVNFDWLSGSPHANVPNNTFVVRWTGDLISNITGTHTFRTTSDDGIRLYINNVAVINNWTNHASTINTGTISLTAGVKYDIRLEYFENGGDAVAKLDWQRPGDATYISLNGSYVTNDFYAPQSPTDIQLSNNTILDGSASGTILGNLTSTDVNTGDSHTYSLVTGIGDSDNSKFSITGNVLSINATPNYALQNIYSIRVRTFDGTYSYEKLFTIYVTAVGSITNGFCGSYYNGTAAAPFVSGNIILKRTDLSINNYWSTSPDASIPNDNFTVRWEGLLESNETGVHSFRTLSDDGVRLFINDVSVINNWTDHGSTANIGTFTLNAGQKYPIRMEFYEKTGGAEARLNWQKPSAGSYSVLTSSNVGYYGSCTVIDTTSPSITGSEPGNQEIIPKHNVDLSFSYADNNGGSGVNTSSIILNLYKWNGSSWGSDITGSYVNVGSGTVAPNYAIYKTNGMPFGKYKTVFTVSDMSGNTSSKESIFYIDEPSFTISTPEINIGELSNISSKFSDTVTVTVKTVGAPFRVMMNMPQNISSSGTELLSWNGVSGLGYQKVPYSSTITTIATQEIFGNQIQNININGEKNTYTYDIQLGALIDMQQSSGDYSGNIDFSIVLDY